MFPGLRGTRLAKGLSMGQGTSAAEYLQAKPKAKEYALSDGDCTGLQMIVAPSGSKQWEFRYRLDGRRRKISILGGYPRVDVKTARAMAREWSQLVAKGIDPAQERKSKREEALARKEEESRTFRAVASTWLDLYARTKPLTDVSRQHIQARFDRDVFPAFGDRLVHLVTDADVSRLVEGIAAEGKADKARRVLWHCRGVFSLAMENGWAEKDPTFNKEKRLPAIRTGNRPALLDPKKVGKLLRDIDGCGSGISTRHALRLLPLVFLRPSELREGMWSEIDFKRELWDIPAERMKGPKAKRRSHLVPLSRQALEILRNLKAENEPSEYVFPSPQTPFRPLSDMAMLKALRALGYGPTEQSLNGFRSIARTLLDERLRIPERVIEAQLAHTVKDSNGTAYNRTQFLDDRKAMMQAWADYLDGLKEGKA